MTQQTSQSGLLFTLAHKQVRARIYSVLEPFDLNPSYWFILGAALAAPEGIRLASVARAMDVKAPLVTMLSSDLIGSGLITRVPHHSDKRAKLLVITPKGKKLCAEIEEKLSVEIDSLLKGASTNEVQTFQKVLEVIISNATE